MAEHLYAVVAFCPHCGFAEPAYRSQDSDDPQPGDLTLCLQCGSWSRWDDAMQLQLPTVEDLRELATSKQARRIEFEWARLKIAEKPDRYLHHPPKKMQ
jgi:hypothetical protein